LHGTQIAVGVVCVYSLDIARVYAVVNDLYFVGWDAIITHNAVFGVLANSYNAVSHVHGHLLYLVHQWVATGRAGTI